MHAIHENQSGFTLIEILIAITIFSVGLLAIAGLQVSAINFNSGSNDRTAGVALAQEVMEQILGWDAGSVNARTPTPPPNAVWDLDPNSAATTITLPGSGTYSATYSVVVDNPVALVSRITVNVTTPQNRVTTLTSFKRYHF